MADANINTTQAAADLEWQSDHIYRSLEALTSMFRVIADLTTEDAEQFSVDTRRLAFLGGQVTQHLAFDIDSLSDEMLINLGQHPTQKAPPKTDDDFMTRLSRLSGLLADEDKRILLNLAEAMQKEAR